MSASTGYIRYIYSFFVASSLMLYAAIICNILEGGTENVVTLYITLSFMVTTIISSVICMHIAEIK